MPPLNLPLTPLYPIPEDKGNNVTVWHNRTLWDPTSFIRLSLAPINTATYAFQLTHGVFVHFFGMAVSMAFPWLLVHVGHTTDLKEAASRRTQRKP